MMMRAWTATLVLAAAPAAANEQVFPNIQQQSFSAPAAGRCGLTRFSVSDFETRSSFGAEQRVRSTFMAAVIETSDPSCIRDYAVVQYIRGCAYTVRYDRASRVERDRSFDISREVRGRSVTFNHPRLEVDTIDADPMYASAPPGVDRHGYLLVPTAPLRLRSDRSSLLSDLQVYKSNRSNLRNHPGPTAATFVADTPNGGISFAAEDGATVVASNASLDFRTCVYRTADIPRTGDPAPEGVAPSSGGPLACFGWQSRYTYDPAAREFVNDRYASVDPYCAQAPR